MEQSTTYLLSCHHSRFNSLLTRNKRKLKAPPHLPPTIKMDLIYWWRHSERPGKYSPAVPLTKLNCAKCHCSLWLMMGNVRWRISLSPAVFTISYFTACCALSENPNKTLWNQQLCHSHPEVQWTAMWSYFFPRGLMARGSKFSTSFPNQTSNTAFMLFLWSLLTSWFCDFPICLPPSTVPNQSVTLCQLSIKGPMFRFSMTTGQLCKARLTPLAYT